LISEFIELSSKGLYCFDVETQSDEGEVYKKITYPDTPILYDDLPDNVKQLYKIMFSMQILPKAIKFTCPMLINKSLSKGFVSNNTFIISFTGLKINIAHRAITSL